MRRYPIRVVLPVLLKVARDVLHVGPARGCLEPTHDVVGIPILADHLGSQAVTHDLVVDGVPPPLQVAGRLKLVLTVRADVGPRARAGETGFQKNADMEAGLSGSGSWT